MASFGISLPTSLAGAGRNDNDLPKLSEQTDLQKMLADEKMRSEQHKTNYQTIKVEHTRLQDEYVKLQAELKSTVEESKLMQDKYKGLVDQSRSELANKHAQCEELRTQVLSEQRLEIIKLQIRDDIENPLRAKIQTLTDENEQFRQEFNKLKYEYSFLKSEYEHESQEHQRIMEEMKLRHDAEVGNLRKEREAVMVRQQNEGQDRDGQKLRVLQRENAQLNLKLKGLLSELEEIRAQREHQGLQSDHVSRMQSKQLAELQASIKALETQKESLRLQNDNLVKELANSNEHGNRMTSRIHDLEKQHIILKNKAEEISHKSKVDLTNMKMSMLKERGELERHRDRLLNEIEEFKSQLEIRQHELDSLSATLCEKERDCVKRIQAAREEEWQKTHSIENEKIELETQLQKIERQKIDDETHQQAEKEKLEGRMAQSNETRDAAEKEALVLRTRVQHIESVVEQLERERAQNAEMKLKLHRLETEYNSYVSNETELLEINAKIKGELDRATEELRRRCEDVARHKEANERGVSEQRAAWAEEKYVLQRRVDELDDQLSQTQVKLAQVGTDQKKKKKKYLKVATRLKDRVCLLQAKMEELQIERDHLKKSVPNETHFKVKKHLNDLLRRHREFRGVMSAADMGTVAIGDISFMSARASHAEKDTANISGNNSNLLSFLETDDHQKELELLKERLNTLDDHQKAIINEFKTFQSTPRKAGAAANLDFETSSEEDKDEDKDNDETAENYELKT